MTSNYPTPQLVRSSCQPFIWTPCWCWTATIPEKYGRKKIGWPVEIGHSIKLFTRFLHWKFL